MKRLFAITALMSGLWCGTASAQWVTVGVSPQSIDPVIVTLDDGADDGCWTNLREVRLYTEEKLEIAGYYVPENANSPPFILDILVLAFRSNGRCVGTIQINLGKFGLVDIRSGMMPSVNMVGSHTALSVSNDNLNNDIISTVKEFIDEM